MTLQHRGESTEARAGTRSKRRRALAALALAGALTASLPPAAAVARSGHDRAGDNAARGHSGAEPRNGRHQRRVPRNFLGVNFEPASGGGFNRVEHNAAMMARNGVETVRVGLVWAGVQPVRDGPYDFSRYDDLLRRLIAHGLNVLPVLELAPPWARKHPGSMWSEPDGVEDYARFAAAAAAHFGPGSDFARDSGHPIRTWQIWNEPNGPYFWNDGFEGGTPIQAPLRDYGKLLHAARDAIRGVDRNARIVLAGLIPASVDGHGVVGSTKALKSLYRMGYGDDFDVLALHPYTRDISNVIYTVRQARRTLDHRGGRKKKIWLTELTWTSAKGRPSPQKFNIEVTERGQARKLHKAFMELAGKRRGLGVRRVYWYTWASPDVAVTASGNANSFNYSGLIQVRGSQRRSKPALRAYRNTARELEGCAKSTNARRCRRR